jgi:hypothetical protein
MIKGSRADHVASMMTPPDGVSEQPKHRNVSIKEPFQTFTI